MSRGLALQAFVAPVAYLQSSAPPIYRARMNYGAAELEAAKSFGADTLRFCL